MSKREFKVGDRVRMVSGRNEGAIGTVKFIPPDEPYFAVEFDSDGFGGHDCGGHAKNPYGWWCDETDVQLVSNDTKIIQKGRTVIAMRGDKKGIARCCPEDTFDLKTGIYIALKRLEDKENYGKPFVPEECEVYYRNMWIDKRLATRTTHGKGFFADELAIAMGNAWRTSEEAVEHTAEIQEKMKKVLAYAKTI